MIALKTVLHSPVDMTHVNYMRQKGSNDSFTYVRQNSHGLFYMTKILVQFLGTRPGKKKTYILLTSLV